MPQPTISIIIPVYNTEKYLRECLDSVLSQTLHDIEIIVVNDASSDHSQDIIDEYVAKDGRIQCIVHPENLGQGEARNKGIAAARGDYITFVDSDDWVENHCYATVIEKIETSGANLGVFSVKNFDEQNISGWHASYLDFPYRSAQRLTAQNINQICCSMCNKVFKREDLQQDILRLPAHLKCEDEEFWFKYVSFSQPLAVGVFENLYHYRLHHASTMSNSRINRKNYPHILQNIRDYLEKSQLYSEYRGSFEQKVVQSLECYEHIFAEYREQYCCDMRQLFAQSHLSMADVLDLDPHLAVYFIEDELLRQFFLKSQRDRWYRFGQLSRKRKLWAIGKALSKKLKIYGLFRPLTAIAKKILQKNQKS